MKPFCDRLSPAAAYRLAALGVAGLLTACGGTTPVSPTPAPAASLAAPGSAPGPTVVGPYRTVSGTIRVVTPSGPQPAANAAVNAWLGHQTFGYSYWWANGPSHADGNGRYELSRVPHAATAWLEAYSANFVQPCAVAIPPSGESASRDIHVVVRADVAAVMPSLIADVPGRVLSGKVVDSARRGVAGVSVAFEPAMEVAAATTVTDVDGRYSLCGLPDTAVTITAWFNGRFAYLTTGVGQNADLVLPD